MIMACGYALDNISQNFGKRRRELGNQIKNSLDFLIFKCYSVPDYVKQNAGIVSALEFVEWFRSLHLNIILQS